MLSRSTLATCRSTICRAAYRPLPQVARGVSTDANAPEPTPADSNASSKVSEPASEEQAPKPVRKSIPMNAAFADLLNKPTINKAPGDFGMNLLGFDEFDGRLRTSTFVQHESRFADRVSAENIENRRRPYKDLRWSIPVLSATSKGDDKSFVRLPVDVDAMAPRRRTQTSRFKDAAAAAEKEREGWRRDTVHASRSDVPGQELHSRHKKSMRDKRPMDATASLEDSSADIPEVLESPTTVKVSSEDLSPSTAGTKRGRETGADKKSFDPNQRTKFSQKSRQRKDDNSSQTVKKALSPATLSTTVMGRSQLDTLFSVNEQAQPSVSGVAVAEKAKAPVMALNYKQTVRMVEQSGGDYRRRFPDRLAGVCHRTPAHVGPLPYAHLALAKRVDLTINQKKKALSVVRRLVAGEDVHGDSSGAAVKSTSGPRA